MTPLIQRTGTDHCSDHLLYGSRLAFRQLVRPLLFERTYDCTKKSIVSFGFMTMWMPGYGWGSLAQVMRLRVVILMYGFGSTRARWSTMYRAITPAWALLRPDRRNPGSVGAVDNSSSGPRRAPVRSAWLRSAPMRTAPRKSAWRRSAPTSEALSSRAPRRSAGRGEFGCGGGGSYSGGATPAGRS